MPGAAAAGRGRRLRGPDPAPDVLQRMRAHRAAELRHMLLDRLDVQALPKLQRQARSVVGQHGRQLPTLDLAFALAPGRGRLVGGRAGWLLCRPAVGRRKRLCRRARGAALHPCPFILLHEGVPGIVLGQGCGRAQQGQREAGKREATGSRHGAPSYCRLILTPGRV